MQKIVAAPLRAGWNDLWEGDWRRVACGCQCGGYQEPRRFRPSRQCESSQKDALVYLAQDAGKRVFCYANAAVRKQDQSDSVLRLVAC